LLLDEYAAQFGKLIARRLIEWPEDRLTVGNGQGEHRRLDEDQPQVGSGDALLDSTASLVLVWRFRKGANRPSRGWDSSGGQIRKEEDNLCDQVFGVATVDPQHI
jgi:hypothetical protein